VTFRVGVGYFDRGCDGGMFGGILFTIMMDMFSFLSRTWGHVHLQSCHSFVIFVYLNYICGIVQVYLLIGFSFQCVVFLMFGPFYHMCILCCVYVERILISVSLFL
jgi:hypothetical protein